MNLISESYRNCEWLIKKHAPVILRTQRLSESCISDIYNTWSKPKRRQAKKHHMSAIEVAEVLRMRAEGKTAYVIARKMGRSQSTIRRQLNKPAVAAPKV